MNGGTALSLCDSATELTLAGEWHSFQMPNAGPAGGEGGGGGSGGGGGRQNESQDTLVS